MPTTSRSLIQQLMDEPHQFEFFQAVRLLEKWLDDSGMPLERMQFRNSHGLQFPPSQIESLEVEEGRVAITPAFFGLLGNHGVLPGHYGERIARRAQLDEAEAAYAWLDIFSSRLTALFFEAWRKHRLELPRPGGGRDGLMPLMLALSGSQVHAVPDEVAAYYAAQFAHRPTSSVQMRQVLHDYLQVPVKVLPCAGRWHPLDEGHQLQLGFSNRSLGQGALLGARMWRRDLTVEIQLGPLNKAQYDDFLTGRPGALALANMLAMFDTPTLRYEVQLVLAAAEVGGVTLTASGPSARLGIDSYLLTAPETRDRNDMRYVI